jgi:hypothetical protein
VASHYSNHMLFQGSVLPYLETNWLRSRLLTIQKGRLIPYRAKVLKRALLAVRTNANGFWMLLSGNAEVAFPSTTATTTPAVNLPTPGTATTAATLDDDAVATLSPAAGATSAMSVSAVDIDATPPVGQKRKARP